MTDEELEKMDLKLEKVKVKKDEVMKIIVEPHEIQDELNYTMRVTFHPDLLFITK
jgi:hypothetical protein